MNIHNAAGQLIERLPELVRESRLNQEESITNWLKTFVPITRFEDGVAVCNRCGEKPVIKFFGHDSTWGVYHACSENPESYIELKRFFESEKEAIKQWNFLASNS